MNGSVGTTGAAPLGSTSYAIPNGAVFVATNGNNSAAGTVNAPFATVTEAIRRAPTGGTIVVRGGTYHERFTVNKQVTIQSYPGEAVWFDGSRAITQWRASGSTWIHDGWNVSFDASPTYSWGAPDNQAQHWGFVNPDHPMAAHPDQVWIDGEALRQVGSRSQVRAGTFFVDKSARELVIGSNPSGKSVRASALDRAIELRADNAVLRGVGVRRYAPSVPHMGTITAERRGVRIENVHVTDNATTGISFLAADQVGRNLTVERNGMLGVHANNSDRLLIDGLRSISNNTERFNQAPVAGGIKVTRSRHVTVTNGQIENNLGTGVWLDESVYDGVVANSVIRNNSGHGISLEISAKMVVANNLIRDNGRFGMKINNVSNVDIWNNSVINNDRPINIVQDNRAPTSASTAGRDRRQPFPDPTMTWVMGPVNVHNNVVSLTKGNCLVCVEDYSKRFSAEQLGVTTNGNVYHRASASSPRWLAVWSRGAGNPAVHNTLADFQRSSGQEARSRAFDGSSIVNSSSVLQQSIRSDAASIALPLPASVAEHVGGVSSGTRQLGAFVGN